MFTYLAEAVSLYEFKLGYDHPETADAYTKIALAYFEAGMFEASCPWLRRAFVIFSKTFGLTDDLTRATYDQLSQLERILDTGLDRVAYTDLPQLIFQLENGSHPQHQL